MVCELELGFVAFFKEKVATQGGAARQSSQDAAQNPFLRLMGKTVVFPIPDDIYNEKG
jgi:hypothetical protein